MQISKEFKIGLFSIIAIALLYIGFNFLKGIDFFSNTHKYYAMYRNIDGLEVSNSVIINGLVVGRVGSISFLQDRENQILVELDIDGNIVLDDSTKAFLISEGFLGGKAIELRMPERITNPLNDGDTIRSEIAMGLIESLTEQTQPVADNVGILIRKFNNIMDSLMVTEQLIRRTIITMNSTLEATNDIVEGNQTPISNSISNMESLTEKLNQSAGSLNAVLTKTGVFVDSLNQLEMSTAINNLTRMSENLNAVLLGMQEGEGTMGKILKDDSLYNNLTRTAEDLDKLLVDLRENPKRYVHFSVFGRKDRPEKEPVKDPEKELVKDPEKEPEKEERE
ncbi:MAG: MCE family protein [Cyclobacteriaceae bacterium]|nr:MCE family protein [Cyclobacteriaceae bacterium]